jgi:DNA-binding transcriptional MerR regulator
VVEIANLTIAEIAEKLGIAESTARRYAKQFSQFLPSKQIGRTMKYSPQALEILRDTAILFKKGHTSEEVQELLGEKYPQSYDGDLVVVEDESTLPADLTNFRELLSQVVKQEIAVSTEELRAEIEDLRDDLEKSQRLNEQLIKQRDERLLQQIHQALERPRRSWWQVVKDKFK